MLERAPRPDQRHARERANAARYRRRQNDRHGKIWVLRVTARVEPTIDLLVRRGILADSVIHTREAIEAGVVRLIDDLTRE